VPGPTPAAGWLYAIAARRLIDAQRRDLADMRRRESLVASISAGARGALMPIEGELELGLLRHLPPDQREVLRARFVEDRPYSEIAAHAGASEASVRQRVSRGLTRLRGPLRVYRAAQQLAREDRYYRYGGGHDHVLDAIAPRSPLDCSAAASLVLRRAGLLPAGHAWSSAQLARHWGQPGEGRYVTLWAGQGHVWLEFKLDSDHGERFDPTPSRLAPHTPWLTPSCGTETDVYPRRWPGL
jgi:hypothetical protein